MNDLGNGMEVSFSSSNCNIKWKDNEIIWKYIGRKRNCSKKKNGSVIHSLLPSIISSVQSAELNEEQLVTEESAR